MPPVFTHPSPGARLISVWGDRRSGPRKCGYGRHCGHDLAAPTGTPLYAMAAGVVSRAARASSDMALGNIGSNVEIDHGGGWSTLYGHMHDVEVVRGQVVDQGQRIGTIGHTGNASSRNPHVHMEIQHNNFPQDPALHGYDGTPPADPPDDDGGLFGRLVALVRRAARRTVEELGKLEPADVADMDCEALVAIVADDDLRAALQPATRDAVIERALAECSRTGFPALGLVGLVGAATGGLRNPIGAITDPIEAVADVAGDVLGALTSAEFWRRLAEGVGGLALVLVAARRLADGRR